MSQIPPAKPASIQDIFGLQATYLKHQVLANGIELAYLQHPPVEESGRTEHHLIFIHTEVPAGMYHEQVTANIFSAGELKTGETIIIPAGVDCCAHWNQEHYYLMLAIAPQAFKQRLGKFEQPGWGSALYVDSLLTTLSVHVARHYSTQKIRLERSAGLPTASLNRVLDYIQVHLDRDLTLAELAAQYCLLHRHVATHNFSKKLTHDPKESRNCNR